LSTFERIEPTIGKIETDPNGLPQHVSGAKMDEGKIRPSLVLGSFTRALTKVCEVGTFGANKYTDNGWLDVANGKERYDDAMVRHWLKLQTGEVLDPETKIEHQAHLAWNALAVLEKMMRDSSG